MENYKLNTEAQNIGGGINEVYNIYGPALVNGDQRLWGSQTEGVELGSLRQIQYDIIKHRIENGLPIFIRVNYNDGYTATFTAVSASPSTTPGRYSFCYIDYNPNSNSYFLKSFTMESDLTCQVYTKII